jgi:hypothetical protein
VSDAGTETGPADITDTASNAWWLGALGALGAAGLVAALLTRRSRGRAAHQARVDRALAEATSLATHLAVLSPEGARAVAAQDAARLLALGSALEACASSEPDPTRRAALGRVRTQVLLVHGIVDAVALSVGPPSEAAITNLHEQGTMLHTTTTRARAEIAGPVADPAGT